MSDKISDRELGQFIFLVKKDLKIVEKSSQNNSLTPPSEWRAKQNHQSAK